MGMKPLICGVRSRLLSLHQLLKRADKYLFCQVLHKISTITLYKELKILCPKFPDAASNLCILLEVRVTKTSQLNRRRKILFQILVR